jgi:hypothetical protein
VRIFLAQDLAGPASERHAGGHEEGEMERKGTAPGSVENRARHQSRAVHRDPPGFSQHRWTSTICPIMFADKATVTASPMGRSHKADGRGVARRHTRVARPWR